MSTGDGGYPGWSGPPGGGPPHSGYPGGPVGGYPAGPPPGGGYGSPPPPGGGYGNPGPGSPGGFGSPPPGYPAGPGGPGYPPPPNRGKRTPVIVAIVGVLVVAIVAVVLVFALKDDDKGGSATPTKSPSAPPTSASPTARPPEQLALPGTLNGKSPLADADVPPQVAQVTTIFGQDFDDVATKVYGQVSDPQAMMVTIGTKRTTVPSDFVTTFVPKAAATEQTATWTRPGTLRCWTSGGASVCLWGDSLHMLYVSSPKSISGTVAVLEKIYLGQAS